MSTIRLRWEEPENRNGIMILYTVMWRELGIVGQENIENSENVTEPAYVLSSLAAYTKFWFSIAAWTEVGRGEFQNISAATEVAGIEIIRITLF